MPDAQMIKIKVIYLQKLYNFAVEHILIWINFVIVEHILIWNFVILNGEIVKLKVVDLEKFQIL
jgi:hypothetical protein